MKNHTYSVRPSYYEPDKFKIVIVYNGIFGLTIEDTSFELFDTFDTAKRIASELNSTSEGH